MSLKIGVVADTHSQLLTQDVLDYWNSEEVDFVVELGDFLLYEGSESAALTRLGELDAVYSQMPNRYYVLGNHDVDYITTQQFYEAVGLTEDDAYQSFDAAEFHVIILNTIDLDATQKAWLSQDLLSTTKKILVFAHYPLSMFATDTELRAIFSQKEGDILMAFTGHSHSYAEIRVFSFWTVIFPIYSGTTYGVVTLEGDKATISGFNSTAKTLYQMKKPPRRQLPVADRKNTWDTRGMAFAVLPKCLQLGSNPESFSERDFPIYKGSEDVNCYFFSSPDNLGEGYVKENGTLFFNNSTNYCLFIDYMISMSEETEMSAIIWVDNRDAPTGAYTAYGVCQEGGPPIGTRRGVSLTLHDQFCQAAILGDVKQTSAFYLEDSRLETAYTFTKKDRLKLYQNDTLKADVAYDAGVSLGEAEEYPVTGFSIGGRVSNGQNRYCRILGFILYERELGLNEIRHLLKLGPTLGGMRGFDDGNGVMRLEAPDVWKERANEEMAKVEGASDIQNNFVSVQNITTTKSGFVAGQKVDALFNG